MSVLGRLRAFFQRAPKPATGRSGSVFPDQALWDQFRRIGGGLTPQQVSEIIRCADSGDMARLVDLANEMRQKDGHLQSVLQTRETALSGLGWEIVFPGQDAKSKRGNRQRKFVETTLRTHPELRRLIAHLTGGVYYGYAVAETIWTTDSKGRMVPRSFVCHSARRFAYRQLDGVFVWRDDGMAYDGIDFLAKYPDKFIVSQPRINGDVPCREGLARVLMWYALFRNWGIADWLKLAEIAWKPYRIGTYEKKSATEDKEALEEIMAAFIASASAVIPETCKIDLKWPDAGGGKGSGGTHDSLIDFAGREMSKATLGQTLTTETGKSGGGSYALGGVHNQVRMDILAADAEHIADVITKYLIEPMIRLNFGPNAPVPRFQFITEDATDMVQFAKAISELRKPGVELKIPAAWVRDKLGIPHPDDDDELVGYDVDLSELEDDPEPENDDDEDVDDEPAADEAA